MLDSLNRYPEYLRTQVLNFKRDLFQVLGVLQVWSVLYLLVQIILGLLPLLAVLILGNTVDALIGARGIGAVTSDLTKHLGYWLALMVVAFLAYIFSLRFSGKAASVGKDVRDLISFGSLIVYLIGILQILLAVIFALIVVFEIASPSLKAKLAGLLVAIVTGIIAANTLIKFTVHRSFTVGEGLAMIGAVAMFVVVYKMRIARTDLTQM